MEEKRRMKPGLFIGSLIVPLAAGGIGTILSYDGIKRFAELNKPALTPPAWVFPIAWTALYILMGLAVYMLLTSDANRGIKKPALIFFSVQLVMNMFWPLIFFEGQAFLAAFIWLAMMWGAAIMAAVMFFRARTAAGLLLLPYIAWTAFAGYLNLAIYFMSITPMPLAG